MTTEIKLVTDGRFVQVHEGDRFAGGVLTQLGANEVNASRAMVAFGKREPLSIRMAKAKRGAKKDPLTLYIVPEFYDSDRKIFPGLK